MLYEVMEISDLGVRVPLQRVNGRKDQNRTTELQNARPVSRILSVLRASTIIRQNILQRQKEALDSLVRRKRGR